MPLQVTTIKTPRFEMGVATAEQFLRCVSRKNDDFDDCRKLSMPLTLVQGEIT
jgi:hypothetical protein